MRARRQLLRRIPRIATAILACALWLPAVAAPLAALPGARDLAADASAVRERKLPIVLFFNRVGCPYCERALREYLTPMQRDPAYRDRALFRQIEIDRKNALVDFAGKPTTHREFATQHKITLTPTIWFVDGEGNALVPPIVGLPTLDFYQAYLERAIDDAQAKLKGNAR